MLNTIVSIFLIATLVVQIVLIMYILITTIKKDRENKKFWDEIHKNIDESTAEYIKQLEKYVTKQAEDSTTTSYFAENTNEDKE